MTETNNGAKKATVTITIEYLLINNQIHSFEEEIEDKLSDIDDFSLDSFSCQSMKHEVKYEPVELTY